ncbi:hypothetical protein HXX76_007893 [Chlamydomonas incerta]|uniref:Prefoldin subunit 4 n=1 Tax=Chlamydomonas incerta TaxID=51695 RepID=A0A835T9P2_CHLIN|nr:hypothetical protein HXX76_007893 [Chlamydomonas incerta]|eukprot:KAG2434166.1 hypothetical protein HXX76_007893 [Chlamydomonas incerta]
MAKAQAHIEVLAEDQQRINAFSRLHMKMQELERKLASEKRYLEELEDASNELMLSDDDNVRFLVGECLVHFEKDTAESRLEEVTKEAQDSSVKTAADLADVKKQLGDLKAHLYAKFGTQINLEEE